MKGFSKNPVTHKTLRSFGLSQQTIEASLKQFTEALMLDDMPSILKRDAAMDNYFAKVRMDRKVLMPAMLRFVQQMNPEEASHLEEMLNLTDLRTPDEWFPQARALKRKVVMHVGPTNSGKTHSAMQRFNQAESAVYCGPLRLLALEIYQRANDNNIPCNLLTGEERRETEDVKKWSCTVEMAQLDRHFDVAVIDEIQMISDSDRGSGWTQALLGLQAKEIHLCGEATAIDIVQKMCRRTGDELEIKTYERLTPLVVANQALNKNVRRIRKGDCLVAFSRKKIFEWKTRIERETGLKAAVIYGRLPPESRAEQAKLFNNDKSGFDVLVASDAIGMGLNLNIRRLIFTEIQKFDGVAAKPLSVSQTKQVAGRAGRFSSKWEQGEVTTMSKADLLTLRDHMRRKSPTILVTTH